MPDRSSPSDKPKTQVTMRDVAKAAGVSRMTVSRALKKNSPIAAETREHILKIVRDLNYVPDQMAGSLTTKKSGFVATLLPSLNNLHFAQTVQGLTEELEKIDLQILLGHTAYSAEREEVLVEALLRRRPEAMVLSYDGHTERTYELLSSVDIPIIEIWERPDRAIGHTVGFSNKDASFRMTQALIAKGYRNITFLGEEDDSWTRGAARRAGFVAAMTAAGLDASRIVQYGAPPLSIDVGALAAEKVMQNWPDTDCIFCVSDLAAFGVQSYLLSKGIQVPAQVAIAGFGNFEVSRFASPSISTVMVDPLTIGRETGALITRLLKARGTDASTNHIEVPADPIFRQSTDNS
ncbi:LacI family DNA-binding transcriptional regulator [Pacificibacter marinus]|uniref:LacI family DNA-binding transcriptional regulator n=1 Tax=Pacificibacter marinus TaxID=658057 RepID=UPI00339D8255